MVLFTTKTILPIFSNLKKKQDVSSTHPVYLVVGSSSMAYASELKEHFSADICPTLIQNILHKTQSLQDRTMCYKKLDYVQLIETLF